MIPDWLILIVLAVLAVFTNYLHNRGRIGTGTAWLCAGVMFGTALAVVLR